MIILILKYLHIFRGENILILDCGHLIIKTELCEKTDISDTVTQMELEEQFYSRLHMDCNDIQILFCDASESWKDARKEKDTEMHILPKTNFSSTFAACVKVLKTVPKLVTL